MRLTDSSCWYCDLKTHAFNEPLFRLGRSHARYLRVWFSIGVGFALTVLLLVSLLLLLELASALHLLHPPNSLRLTSLVFGFWRSNVSLSGAAYIFISTLLSVSVHEFGHALAAASDGIRLEYVAIFLATLFPGALVAFDYDLLRASPRFTSLRVYCAGIWHNAVFCALCGLGLLLLPLILFPFYIHGENPMVLDVPSVSPLFGYLSPGDVILSFDGIRVHNPRECMEIADLLHKRMLQSSNDSLFLQRFSRPDARKGYCVPNSLMEESNKIQLVTSDQFACPEDLSSFVTTQCLESAESSNLVSAYGQPNVSKNGFCLNAKDIVKLRKCGDGWMTAVTVGSSCLCSHGESCLSPDQLPGSTWTEIMYSSPYSPECLELQRSSSADFSTSKFTEHNCAGAFVFVGDLISMLHAVRLTAYQPYLEFPFSAYIPNLLEKSLIYMFHVSLTLALLNSLPVYFLDGESILEVILSHFTALGLRKRRKVLQVCLLGGTLISILSFLRMFAVNFL